MLESHVEKEIKTDKGKYFVVVDKHVEYLLYNTNVKYNIVIFYNYLDNQWTKIFDDYVNEYEIRLNNAFMNIVSNTISKYENSFTENMKLVDFNNWDGNIKDYLSKIVKEGEN